MVGVLFPCRGSREPRQAADLAARVGSPRKFLRFLAGHADLQDIFFLWRPFLSDPDDDMILELAFAAGCRYIVTHNLGDFRGCGQLGSEAITPRDFLAILNQTTKP